MDFELGPLMLRNVALRPGAGPGGTPMLSLYGVSPRSYEAPPPIAPTITSGASVPAEETVHFSYHMTATGRPTPAVHATGLPPWLSQSGATVSGTPPMGAGPSATFTVVASNGVLPDASQPVTINISGAPGLTAPTITSASAVTVTEGVAWTYTIAATGNPIPTIGAAIGLPAWATQSGAVITGTPPAGSAPGATSFTVNASNGVLPNASQVVNVTIQEPAAPWTVTHTFPVQVTFTPGTILLNAINWVGWTSAMDADMADDLYDATSMATLPVNLWASYRISGVDQPFTVVPFDNWSNPPGGTNAIREWGYRSSNHSIYITGNNSTGQPIRLELRKS